MSLVTIRIFKFTLKNLALVKSRNNKILDKKFIMICMKITLFPSCYALPVTFIKFLTSNNLIKFLPFKITLLKLKFLKGLITIKIYLRSVIRIIRL